MSQAWIPGKRRASVQLALLSQVRGEMTSCVALPRRAIVLVLRVLGRLTGFLTARVVAAFTTLSASA